MLYRGELIGVNLESGLPEHKAEMLKKRLIPVRNRPKKHS
jgi:hypothetical protein